MRNPLRLSQRLELEVGTRRWGGISSLCWAFKGRSIGGAEANMDAKDQSQELPCVPWLASAPMVAPQWPQQPTPWLFLLLELSSVHLMKPCLTPSFKFIAPSFQVPSAAPYITLLGEDLRGIGYSCELCSVAIVQDIQNPPAESSGSWRRGRDSGLGPWEVVCLVHTQSMGL